MTDEDFYECTGEWPASRSEERILCYGCDGLVGEDGHRSKGGELYCADCYDTAPPCVWCEGPVFEEEAIDRPAVGPELAKPWRKPYEHDAEYPVPLDADLHWVCMDEFLRERESL